MMPDGVTPRCPNPGCLKAEGHRGAHDKPLNEGGEQESYLPPIVPPRHVNPPADAQFGAAAYLKAGPEIDRIVATVLDYDEFKGLQPLDYGVLWRRDKSPGRDEDHPIYTSTEIINQVTLWEAHQREIGWPRYWLNLHWQSFAALRENGFYLHDDILAQHVHHALSGLMVVNDIVRRAPPDFAGWTTTVQRFGLWNDGLVGLRKPFRVWAQLELDDAMPPDDEP